MADIVGKVQAIRGDLIYGLREAREYYFTRLGVSDKGKDEMTHAWVALDNYNNHFGVWDPVGDSWKKSAKEQTLKKFAQKVGEIPENEAPHGSVYYDRLMKSRFSPANVIDMTTDDMLKRTPKEKGSSFEQELLKLRGDDREEGGTLTKAYTVIRRACKFGLGMVVTQQKATFPSARIHFLLDGLNLSEVAAKTANAAGVPITYSELRYCFRNWDELRKVVLFYVRGDDVKAPWEEAYDKANIFSTDSKEWSTPSKGAWLQPRTIANPDDWKAYGARRVQKHGGKIPVKDLI